MNFLKFFKTSLFKILVFYFPFIYLFSIYILKFTNYYIYYQFVKMEGNGETAQHILYFLSFILTVNIIFSLNKANSKSNKLLWKIMCIVLLIINYEENSFYFNSYFGGINFINDINIQNETNIHNLYFLNSFKTLIEIFLQLLFGYFGFRIFKKTNVFPSLTTSIYFLIPCIYNITFYLHTFLFIPLNKLNNNFPLILNFPVGLHEIFELLIAMGIFLHISRMSLKLSSLN